MTDTVAKLTIGDKTYEFPVLSGTVGPDVIDIRSLYAKTGMFTYDPGFTSTAACDSSITYIDGDVGELMYRGYPIEQLAEKSNYLEVCYLLLYGDLPNKAQLTDFEQRVTRHTMVHEQMHYFYRGFRRDAHPMAIVCGVVGAMAAFYHDSIDINDPEQREIASIRMIAKIPTIVAMAYKYSVGQPFVYPRNDLDYASNFLRMCFSVPAEDYVVNPVIARAMDLIFTPMLDHEQNAFDLDGQALGSSDANPFACIAAGVACASGAPPTAALTRRRSTCSSRSAPRPHPRVHREGQGQELRLPPDGLRPPRLQELRPARQGDAGDGQPGARALGAHNLSPTLQVAKELERIALSDEYFVSRKLYPNVDFYSASSSTRSASPTSMFTAIFALSRTVGWIAQWKEMIADPERRSAGRASSTTAPRRDYVPVGGR